MKPSLAAIIILFSLFIKTEAQSLASIPHYTLTSAGSYFEGFVLKHDRYMTQLAQGITRGFEIDLDRNTYGYQVWEQVYHYPDAGVSISGFDYGSPLLGQSLALAAHADFYLVRKKRLELTFRLGAGIGLHDKPYNRETNNQNIAVGSPVTNCIGLKLGLNYRIGNLGKITAGLETTHFSVAAYTQPNKGLNIITAGAGFAWRISPSTPEFIPLQENYTGERSLRYQANFSFGMKQIPPIGSPRYPVYGFTFYLSKPVSKTNILCLGIDGFDNTALKARQEQTYSGLKNAPDVKRIGITAGHELRLNRISLLTQFGVYVYRPYKVEKPVYQRYALNYYISDHFYIHYGFVSHYAKASHGELGLGIRL